MTMSVPALEDADVLASSVGRDIGPISARNTSRGSLIHEAHKIFRAAASGLDVRALHDACLSGQLLRQPTRAARQKVWAGLYWRYFAWDPPGWVLTDLAAAAERDSNDPRLVGLLYVHFARRDRLAYEFVTQFLWSKWKRRELGVTPDDLLDYLSHRGEFAVQARRWTDAGRRKLARNLMASLRDFGVLYGARRKSLQGPIVPPEVALHLVRLLVAEGLRGRSVLESADWRLFLWDIESVVNALAQLAQERKLRFERSRSTVILELPRHVTGDAR